MYIVSSLSFGLLEGTDANAGTAEGTGADNFSALLVILLGIISVFGFLASQSVLLRANLVELDLDFWVVMSSRIVAENKHAAAGAAVRRSKW